MAEAYLPRRLLTRLRFALLHAGNTTSGIVEKALLRVLDFQRRDLNGTAIPVQGNHEKIALRNVLDSAFYKVLGLNTHKHFHRGSAGIYKLCMAKHQIPTNIGSMKESCVTLAVTTLVRQ